MFQKIFFVIHCLHFILYTDSSSDESGSESDNTEQESTSQTSSPTPKKLQRRGQKRKAVPDNSEGLLISLTSRSILKLYTSVSILNDEKHFIHVVITIKKFERFRVFSYKLAWHLYKG